MLKFSVQILLRPQPYALEFNWGDGTSDIYSTATNGTFEATHTYAESGIYIVTIKGTDADQQLAFFQQTAVINGEGVGGIFDPNQQNAVGTIVKSKYILWPLYVLGGACVWMYLLGRRHASSRNY